MEEVVVTNSHLRLIDFEDCILSSVMKRKTTMKPKRRRNALMW